MVSTSDLPESCPSCKNESQNPSNHPAHTGTHAARKTNPQLAGAVLGWVCFWCNTWSSERRPGATDRQRNPGVESGAVYPMMGTPR
jgi:hypothetical protein